MNRSTTLRKIVMFYGPRPHRAREILLWARDRTAETLRARRPWWPYPAVNHIAEMLPARARVLEYGGGGSTLWLADKGAEVDVVEHDPSWVAALSTCVDDRTKFSVTVVEPTIDPGTVTSAVETGYFDDYAAAASAYPEEHFDLVIVDGRARVACGLAALTKVKPGGMLLLDDSDRTRYEPLRRALVEWDRTDHKGAKIGGGPIFQTSVWTRPNVASR